MMRILLLCSALIYIPFSLRSKSEDQNEKGASSDPREQFDATKEASNVVQEQSTKTEESSSRKEGCSVSPTEHAIDIPEKGTSEASNSPGKGGRKGITLWGLPTKLRQAWFPSPQQPEDAGEEDSTLADEMKQEKQSAVTLIGITTGAIMVAKGTELHIKAGKQPNVGGEAAHHLGFFFWWSNKLWCACYLSSMFVTLLTSSRQRTQGKLVCAKTLNCITVILIGIGVSLWISA